MKYEKPEMEIMEWDYIFTLDESSGVSSGSNENNTDVGGWVPKS